MNLIKLSCQGVDLQRTTLRAGHQNRTRRQILHPHFLIHHASITSRAVYVQLCFKVTVDLQRPNFVTFFSFAPDVAKESI